MSFRVGTQVANAGSILSILLLAATVNTQVEIQATGEDEEAAVQAVEAFFQSSDEEAASRVQPKEMRGATTAKVSADSALRTATP